MRADALKPPIMIRAYKPTVVAIWTRPRPVCVWCIPSMLPMPRRQAALKRVKVGDSLTAIGTEAFAVALEPV